ncbi:MAG: GAF domain-containing protein, partial [Dehalococcoidia bacterium]
MTMPLNFGGEVVGAWTLLRYEKPPHSDAELAEISAYAEQMGLAIGNARAAQQLEERNRELTEALEQQAATAEVLEVISRAPGDLLAAFDSIVRSVARLAGASNGDVWLVDGGELVNVAGLHAVGRTVIGARVPITPGRFVARAVLEQRAINFAGPLEDFEAEFPESAALALGLLDPLRETATADWVWLAVPLFAQARVVGVLLFVRTGRSQQPFRDADVRLAEAFGRQAVIAIENARLFNELQDRNREVTEALEDQRAVAEVLEVISREPTELERTLDALVHRLVTIIPADDARVVRYALDDQDEPHSTFAVASRLNPSAEGAGTRYNAVPLPREGTPAAEARRTLQPVQFAGTVAEWADAWPRMSDPATEDQVRLLVPLVREGVAVGNLRLMRLGVTPFTDREVALSQTFADQAVIAIENARLFNELQDRNRDVTEALDTQTSMAEVLRIIASSPTELRSVLQSLGDTIARLLRAGSTGIFRVVNGDLIGVSVSGSSPAIGGHPSLTQASIGGRAALTKTAIHVPDLALALEEFPHAQLVFDKGGRSVLALPLLREEESIGVISVVRTEVVAPFSEAEVTLGRTFADQAVIAIENARLFNELQDRNREVTEALERERATRDVLSVISRTPTDPQPVFDAMAESAARLFEDYDAITILLADAEVLRIAAHVGPARPPDGWTRAISSRWAAGRSLLERRTIHIPDFLAVADEYPEGAATAQEHEYRTMVAVPLLRAREGIGVITVRRTVFRPFTPEEVTLIETFADQAVIAIENARLFNELQDRNREVTEALDQQTAMAEVLSVISNSPAQIRPVFDAIVERAARLCDAEQCVLYEVDGEMSTVAAQFAREGEEQRYAPVGTVRALPGRVLEVAVRSKETFRFQMGIAEFHERFPEAAANIDVTGKGEIVSMTLPLLREGSVIGALQMHRFDAAPFADNELSLVQTFADQAVIAIENARLFNELEER